MHVPLAVWSFSGWALVPTGLRVAIPEGYEMQVRPRSGLALKHGVGLANSPGTIDSDYRGPIGVIVVNLGAEPFAIAHGDRIAQLVVAPVTRGAFVEAEEIEGEAVEVAAEEAVEGVAHDRAGVGPIGVGDEKDLVAGLTLFLLAQVLVLTGFLYLFFGGQSGF